VHDATGPALRVLALEPYYGGSHRAFLDQWAERSCHHFTVLTLPPRKWKWRMRQGAVTFSHELRRHLARGERWDVLWCSDMLNLAELLGLVPAEIRSLPAVAYFHENQVTYPVRHEQERDAHFGLTNLTTALAADAVWFNSAFHRDSFLDAVPTFLRKMPDYRPLSAVDEIRGKAMIEAPGVETPPPSPPRPRDAPLVVAWVARWEYDKGPEIFFRALFRLLEEKTPFRVVVLGERYRETPPIFVEARRRLRSRIDAWGYEPSRRRYLERLGRADVVVSTAEHEFFGLAVLEAVLAGAFPLLPRRLSYPELLRLDDGGEAVERHFYDGGAAALAKRLATLARQRREGVLDARAARLRAERFLWSRRAPALDRSLAALYATTAVRN
jgi:glycosyltransferase involved in cell wall biosynthesis